jgi:hypothetical protein
MKNKTTSRAISLFFLLILLLVSLTFYNSFYRLTTNNSNYSAWVIIHAFSLAVWVILLFTQPLLIYADKPARHKQIGLLSIGIVALIVVSTIFVALDNFKAIPFSGKKYSILLTQLYGIALFACFYTLALLNAKQFNKHIQYMIVSTIIIIGPVIFRNTYKSGLDFFGTIELTANIFTYSFLNIFLLALCLVESRRRESIFPYAVTMLALIPMELSQVFFSWRG